MTLKLNIVLHDDEGNSKVLAASCSASGAVSITHIDGELAVDAPTAQAEIGNHLVDGNAWRDLENSDQLGQFILRAQAGDNAQAILEQVALDLGVNGAPGQCLGQMYCG